MAMFYGYDRDTLSLRGGTMIENIDMDNNTILNIKNLIFSDTLDSIDLNDKQLKGLAVPSDPQDAVSKGYTEANFLQLSGGTMSGNIAMDNNIISNIKNLTFSDAFDRIDLNGKQLKQLGNPTDSQDATSKNYTDSNFLRLSGGTMAGPLALHPGSVNAQSAVSKNYTDSNFLKLSGGTMAGPLTLRFHPTENFHPCTKQFTEELVRRGRKVELVYGEWGYKAIGRSRLRYSGEFFIVGNTLAKSSNAVLNIIAITFYTSSTPYRGQSIRLLLSLRYSATDGARGTANLGTIVLSTWRINSRSYGNLLTSQVDKEFNLHKTLTRAVTTSIRSFDIGIRHGQGGSELPSGEIYFQ